MLEKVSSAMLISDVASFADNYKALAEDIEVKFRVETCWKPLFRMSCDIVILGSKFLNDLNKAYYPAAVLILKEGESPFPYMKMGITKFIFNYKNKYELLSAFYQDKGKVIHTSSLSYEGLLKGCKVMTYQFGDYDFRFDVNRFLYKGKPVYLAESVKKYLAEWLLNGHKDNKKRMILCTLRKRLGEAFLKDVDRFGQLKGGKNE